MAPHVFAVVSAGKTYDNANPRALNDSVEKSATLDKEVCFESLNQNKKRKKKGEKQRRVKKLTIQNRPRVASPAPKPPPTTASRQSASTPPPSWPPTRPASTPPFSTACPSATPSAASPTSLPMSTWAPTPRRLAPGPLFGLPGCRPFLPCLSRLDRSLMLVSNKLLSRSLLWVS